ncbi:MAG: glycerol-3-phosphate acyltransferase [Dehalococcoidales bacterium]|nr:glycerol-3-phosphate acyltransferase [Dehalococcoidales bacterium]
MVITGITGIIIGYLLGSIPSAYIATRIATSKDIRQLGGGNVGGLNVFREVGFWPALAVGIVDLGKGAATVAIALWLLDLSPVWVMLSALAVVIGHNWMLFLRFTGGKGMGAALGSLLVLLPAYGYPQGLLFLFGAILVPFIITRNVALSMGVSLLSLPFITGFGMKSGMGTLMAIVLGLIIGLKFLPTARAAWVKSKNKSDFIFDRGRKAGEKKAGD